MRPPETAGPGEDVTVFNRHLRAERFEPLDVLVHGTRPDGTAPGEAHVGAAEAGREGTKRQDGSSHRLDEVVRCFRARDARSVEDDLIALPSDDDAHAFEKAEHRAHVGKIGHVRENKVFRT